MIEVVLIPLFKNLFPWLSSWRLGSGTACFTVNGDGMLQKEGVTREQLWEHALKSARVATALRLALDDGSPQVVLAAAQGVSALLGGTEVALQALLPSGEIIGH